MVEQDRPHTFGHLFQGIFDLGHLRILWIAAAVGVLMRGEAVAIVSDAPILQYYDNQHPKIPITEVGPIFDPHNYGFTLPKNSPRLLPINEALLSILESGYLQALGKSYFGDVFQL